jgi:xylulokinase
MSVLAVDIGSSRIKAVLAGWDGRVRDVRSAATPRQSIAAGESSYPLDDVQRASEDLIAGAAEANRGDRIDTLVFSCLGTAMAPIAADGQPLGPALAPADLRPLADPGRMAAFGIEAHDLYRRTGSDPTVASFLGHALWWQAERPAVLERTQRFRSLRGHALATLCGVDVEDHSWASRTMLVDLETDDWSPEILAAAGLPIGLFPALVPSTTAFPIRASVVERLGLAHGARAVAGAMDNCCAVFGAAGPARSGLVNIVGTYEHMAGAASLGAVRSVAAASDAIIHRYLLPGQFVTMTRVPIGALLAAASAGAAETLDELLDGLAPRPVGDPLALDSGAVQAAVRSGRPHHEILQGLVEAAAGVLARFADAWAALGLPAEPIAVVGGGSGHDAVLRLKATMLDRTLVTLAREEGAALGALRLAAMATRGASVAESCTLFENPIDRTIRPGCASSARPAEGVTST